MSYMSAMILFAPIIRSMLATIKNNHLYKSSSPQKTFQICILEAISCLHLSKARSGRARPLLLYNINLKDRQKLLSGFGIEQT